MYFARNVRAGFECSTSLRRNAIILGRRRKKEEEGGKRRKKEEEGGRMGSIEE